MKLILKLSLLVLILIFSASNSSAQKLDEYIQMWGHDIKWWRLATPQDVENQIQQGANVNDKDINGTTALMYAALNKNPQIIETFINYKADVNAKNEIGETALMTAAAFNQNPEVIDTLIKYKADV
ncbi:MAG: ankyrin repeat domain-containing protein, partial [Alphaproteobacteria bacterium]|nr:ankyrin repeat domain-containing protein [Alphaproteobacteria bacterium]